VEEPARSFSDGFAQFGEGEPSGVVGIIQVVDDRNVRTVLTSGVVDETANGLKGHITTRVLVFTEGEPLSSGVVEIWSNDTHGCWLEVEITSPERYDE
jgi:hypothetical protein